MRRTPRTYQTAADRWAGIGPYYAMFPVWFADAVVREFTVPGDVVVDPFAGRGTSIFSASVQGREVVDGIDESRRLGIEESVSREEIGQRSVGTVRRRPATDLEMLHIVFERLHQRLIILPAVARALQRFLGVHEIFWRVDPEFASL